MAKTHSSVPWQQAEVVLTGTIVAFVTVLALYWAKVVFIPVALAVFLTFLLSPVVLTLQRQGLGRILSIVLVVTLAALILTAIIWLVAQQVTYLITDLPNHTENIKQKIRAVRELTGDSLSGRLDGMIDEITREWTRKPPASTNPVGDQATPVVVQPPGSPWLSRLPDVLGPFVEPVGSMALAVVLSIFMLLKREDLRDRFIRLMGRGRMAVTTRAVDDGAARVSRYLFMQLLVNGSYGLAWGVGLFFFDVKYAVLWGFLAAVLRYVPYIGAPIAALLPLTLSLVTYPGWSQPLLVVAYLIVLELVSNNVIEPWLYGQSIGVSEVALLIAAAFWAFLWGPIGLVLSGPLIVCLVVLGKYVPQLEFFDILLGDAPPLSPQVSVYQRLLAGDQDEAEELVREHAKNASPEEVSDNLLIPVLTCVRRDRERDDLTDGDERFILQALEEIIDDLDEKAPPKTHEENRGDDSRVRVLGCAARDELDELALRFLQRSLDPTRWEMTVAPAETLASELLTRIEETEPAVVCIASLPPGGLAHTRYVCKRLRARFPEIKIVVGRWGLKGNLGPSQTSLQEAGADLVAATLRETRTQMNSWLPVLANQAEPARVA